MPADGQVPEQRRRTNQYLHRLHLADIACKDQVDPIRRRSWWKGRAEYIIGKLRHILRVRHLNAVHVAQIALKTLG